MVPPPRRADSARAFLTRASFAGQRGLLIKQKPAAQGNTEETSGQPADATPGTSFSGTGHGALSICSSCSLAGNATSRINDLRTGLSAVVAGLVPAIHVFLAARQ
jgi:hypothetical protein